MGPKSALPAGAGEEPEVGNETTPLLNNKANGSAEQPNGAPPPGASNEDPSTKDDEDEDKPLPVTQILLLCYTCLAEPIAFFALFPFINEMIHLKGGIPEDNVGFWSGAIESLFSIVQMVLMIFYGRSADRLGRKPVLVFSLAGVGVATALFGMGQSLAQMIVTRCVAGAFAGSVLTVRTMISENCTKRTQGTAFSWYMFVRNTGIFLGPLIGGGLANPAQQFPSVFGGVLFWEKYPYALSTYVAGAVCFSSAITTLFFVKETLKRKPSSDNSPAEPPMSTWRVIKAPGVGMVLFIYGYVMVMALSYTSINPVFMYTQIKKGGLGFSDQQIALFIALAGAGQALWILLAFPTLQRRTGTGTVMRATAVGWPLFMALYPVLNEFLRKGWTTVFWVLGPIGILIGSYVSMGFACIQLFVNDISPSPAVLGTANALALTVSSAVRAVAPVAGTSIYAVGVKWGFAHGHLVWFVLVILGLGLVAACLYIPEAAEGRLDQKKKTVAPEQGAESGRGEGEEGRAGGA